MNALHMFAVVSSLLAFGAANADAAALTSAEKLEVKVKKTSDEDTKRIWERFGSWCGIAEWHPAVLSCTEGKEGNVLYRTLSLKGGGKIKEKLLALEPTSYRYAIVESPLPVKNYEAQFSAAPDKDRPDEVDVVWSASYDAADGKADADARGAIDGIFRDGIASIRAKVPTMPEKAATDATSKP
jgi:hypothetical protein